MTVLTPTSPPESFAPSVEEPRALRNAFGQFATGVTLVTVGAPEGPIAIAANSFTSVSLDPPLLLWAPQKASRRAVYFVGAEHFAIHVLAADQADLCCEISKDMHALGARHYLENAEGVPLLEGCLARFECTTYAVHDGGDHNIIIGKVLRAALAKEGDALGFFKGRMTRITAPSS